MQNTAQPKPKKSKALTALLAFGMLCVCALAAFYAYVATAGNAAKPLEKPLKELLAESFGPWSSEEVPMAQSEEMKARVEGILKYDDALTRTYQGPGMRLSLYVAYWNVGKIPVHEVGVHNPDTCWVVNGWKCLERKHDCRQTVRGRALKPFEYGMYKKDGRTEHVIFWHLVGDGINRFEYSGWRDGLAGKLERLPFMFESFKKFGLGQRREQLFIRLSSTIPFSELWDNPDFQDYIEQMAPLRIFEPQPPALP